MFTSLKDHMDVAVDQPGHQRAPAAIDHVGARRLDRLVGHLPDGLALDQQLEAALQLADFGLKQLEIPEQKLRHCDPPRRDHRTMADERAQEARRTIKRDRGLSAATKAIGRPDAIA